MSAVVVAEPVRFVAITLYIVLLVAATSLVVGFAAQNQTLLAAALPLPLIPILGLHNMRPSERLAGWAVFTVWLGSTYATSGQASELLVFGIITVCAVAGYFHSPWWLVAPWFLHVGWDFVPRELPPLYQQLPLACMIFDGLIGIYLLLMTLSRSLCRSAATARPAPLSEPSIE